MTPEIEFQPVEVFLEQFGGDKDVALEITGIARSDAQLRAEQVERTAREGDAHAYAKQLHALRGVIATFGCESLAGWLHEKEMSTEQSGQIAPSLTTEVLAATQEFLAKLSAFEDAIRQAS